MTVRPIPTLAALATTAVLATALTTGLTTGPAAAQAGGTEPRPRSGVELVSVATDGSQRESHADLNGSANVASADGRYVVFVTRAALVARDRNHGEDVYRRDTVAHRTVLVSATPEGRAGNDVSFEPSLSADGTKVSFTTAATDLLSGSRRDTNGDLDVVWRDLTTRRTVLVTQDNGGRQRKASSYYSVISGDGEHVAFQTHGGWVGTDRDKTEDVYVRDVVAKRIRKASWTVRGKDIVQPHLVGTLSHDGRVVTMGDDKHVWARDLRAGRTTLVWSEQVQPDADLPIGTVGRPAVSGNGRYVAFASAVVELDRLGPTDGHPNIYRRDLRTGATVRVTHGLDGEAPDSHSGLPSLSYSGRWVGVSSFAGNLTRNDAESGDADAFVVDLRTGRTTLASPGPEGLYDDSTRTGAAITADGRAMVYESFDSGLVPGDDNGYGDVFIWRR